MGVSAREGLFLAFGKVFPCFFAVAPMSDFSEGDVGWFGVGYGCEISQGKIRGGLEDPFSSWVILLWRG